MFSKKFIIINVVLTLECSVITLLTTSSFTLFVLFVKYFSNQNRYQNPTFSFISRFPFCEFLYKSKNPLTGDKSQSFTLWKSTLTSESSEKSLNFTHKVTFMHPCYLWIQESYPGNHRGRTESPNQKPLNLQCCSPQFKNATSNPWPTKQPSQNSPTNQRCIKKHIMFILY